MKPAHFDENWIHSIDYVEYWIAQPGKTDTWRGDPERERGREEGGEEARERKRDGQTDRDGDCKTTEGLRERGGDSERRKSTNTRR